MIYYILRWLLSIIMIIMFRGPIKGVRNLQAKGGALIVSNHSSWADIFVLVAHTLRPIHFIAKSELFKNKALALVLKAVCAFPVKRDTADIKAIKTCIDLTAKGKIVGIFPEGTTKKYKDGEIGEIKQGVALIALKAKAQIIPVFFAKKTRLFRRNYVTAGAPYGMDDLYSQKVTSELMDEAAKRIYDSIAALSRR